MQYLILCKAYSIGQVKLVASSTLDQLIFEIPQQFHSWILNNFPVMDSKHFSEIYLA